jgi:hypothetical protein
MRFRVRVGPLWGSTSGRIGVRAGPISVSAGGRRRRRTSSSSNSGCSTVIGYLLGIALLIGWPFALEHAVGATWMWVIVGVWWGLLALILLLAFNGWLTGTPGKGEGSTPTQASHPVTAEPGVEAQLPSHPAASEVRGVLIRVFEIALDKTREEDGAEVEHARSLLRQMKELRASDPQIVRLARLIPDVANIPQLVSVAADRHSLHTKSAHAVLASLIGLAAESGRQP